MNVPSQPAVMKLPYFTKKRELKLISDARRVDGALHSSSNAGGIMPPPKIVTVTTIPYKVGSNLI